jgi:predicted RNA binding protein YcfA (HicA-like mRNA interferase family)
MGRLSGFSYREVVQKLRAFGFQFDRQGPGSHEIWRQAQTGSKITIPHHRGDMAEARCAQSAKLELTQTNFRKPDARRLPRGKMAGWIAPPERGINTQPVDFEYVRFN